jgi:hypothetical protein
MLSWRAAELAQVLQARDPRPGLRGKPALHSAIRDLDSLLARRPCMPACHPTVCAAMLARHQALLSRRYAPNALFNLSRLEGGCLSWRMEPCSVDCVQGMLADLQAAPQGAILILHACAHNPTGGRANGAWPGHTRIHTCTHVCPARMRTVLPLRPATGRPPRHGRATRPPACLRGQLGAQWFDTAGLACNLAGVDPTPEQWQGILDATRAK